MFNEFRRCYPQGSLISELVEIHGESYIVRMLAQVEGITLLSAFGSGKTIEIAEDQARDRLLNFLNLKSIIPVEKEQISKIINLSSDEIIIETIENQEKDISTTTKVTKSKKSKKVKDEVTPDNKPVETIELVLENEVITQENNPIETIELGLKNEVITEETKPVETSKLGLEIPENKLDFEQILTLTEKEMKRIGWTADQGQKYLIETYGKRSRQLLKDDELLEFLRYLESLPSPANFNNSVVNSPINTTEKSEEIKTDQLEFGQILTLTEQEMKRIGWTADQGQKYLIETYGKRSRQLLKDDELLEFLRYLENLPSPSHNEANSQENNVNLMENITENKPQVEQGEMLNLQLEFSQNTTTQPVDFSDINAKIKVEIKRLGWAKEQQREYLLSQYDKTSLQLLSDSQLMEFLQYLEQLPNP